MALHWHRDGDPRERFPGLATAITDEALALWAMYRLCLCGCGQQTKLRHPDTPGSTEANYFVLGHSTTLRARLGLMSGRAASPRQKRAARAANYSRCVPDATAILSLVREHVDTHFGGSIHRFAQHVGEDTSALCYNLKGKTRLSNKRAVRLLKAIGEPIPASLRSAV